MLIIMISQLFWEYGLFLLFEIHSYQQKSLSEELLGISWQNEPQEVKTPMQDFGCIKFLLESIFVQLPNICYVHTCVVEKYFGQYHITMTS